MVRRDDSQAAGPGRLCGHERGQLVLIAAVAIAFVVVGIVVVWNGVVYVDAISASETTRSVGDVETTEAELEGTVREIAARADDESDFEETLQAAARLYEGHANASSAGVTTVDADGITYDADAGADDFENVTDSGGTIGVPVTHESTEVTYDRTVEVAFGGET